MTRISRTWVTAGLPTGTYDALTDGLPASRLMGFGRLTASWAAWREERLAAGRPKWACDAASAPKMPGPHSTMLSESREAVIE